MSLPAKRLLPLTCALLLVPVAGASAATVEVSGSELQITDATGLNDVVTVTSGGGNSYVVNDTAGVSSSSCSVAGTAATCSIPGGANLIRATLGAGNDTFNPTTLLVPVNVNGGPGDDTLSGSPAPPFLAGAVLDVFSGGDGLDTVSYAGRAAPVRVEVDGYYGSGQANEYDLVNTDVESVIGGAGNDTLLGHDGVDVFYGGGGNDFLDGREGDDALYGQAGDDGLYGREGTDLYDGGDGNDTIASRDSAVAETVSCGAGTDVLTADAADTASDCETVNLPDVAPVVTPEVTLVPTPTPTAQPQPETPAASPPAVVTIVERTVFVERNAKMMQVTLSCGADQVRDCRGTVVITTRIPAKASKKRAAASRRGVRLRTLELGKAKFRVAAGKTKVVSAKVSRRGVSQALKNTKSTNTSKGRVKRVKARMTISMRSGDGGRTTIQRPFVVEVADRPGAGS